MGLRNAETIKKVLDIPQNENVVSVIGIGYSETAPTMPKRKTIEEITRFYEDWSKIHMTVSGKIKG